MKPWYPSRSGHGVVHRLHARGTARRGLAGGAIKRVALELGGKSAALVLPGADLALAVKTTLAGCMLNSGQTCSATTRLLVPRPLLVEVERRPGLLEGYRMGTRPMPRRDSGPWSPAPSSKRSKA